MALFCLFAWRYFGFSRGVFSRSVISPIRVALFRLFAWLLFVFLRGVFSRGVFSRGVILFFRVALFRLFVISSFAWSCFVFSSFRLFVWRYFVFLLFRLFAFLYSCAVRIVTRWFDLRPKKIYMCVCVQVSALKKKLGMIGRHNILFCQNILYRYCIFQYIFQQIWQPFAHNSQ